MGCGQSKIHLYPRKSKSKANGKKGGHADSDAETDEDEGHIEDTEKYQQTRDREKNDEDDDQSNKDSQETDEDVTVSLLRAKNLSLLQNQAISSSQQNFFRMLDKKIEEGPDYDSASETEIALEEARLNALVQHWESASLTASVCSSSASRSLQTTPVRQVALKQLATVATPRTVMQTTIPQQQVLSSDFLPHGVVPPQLAQPLSLSALPSGGCGALKQHPQSQQQQQIVISHLNTKMLHQMVALTPQQMQQMSMSPETSSAAATTANTSNAHALMQSAQQPPPPPPLSQQQQQQQQAQQQYAHMLSLPGVTGGGAQSLSPSPQQLMGKPPNANVSPKRIGVIDSRLLMNPQLAQQLQQQTPQQMHQQMQMQQQQFMTTSSAMAAPQAPPGYLNGGTGGGVGGTVVGGRSPQPGMPMQMAYFGQMTAQQNMQVTSQLEQQQQQTPPQGQSQQASYYGDVIHNVPAPTEYRFPPAISVQRLAPQVQRQLRETQELIKDSCPQLYAGYGSPGPPIRNQTRNPTRRPTLETQFSQELS